MTRLTRTSALAGLAALATAAALGATSGSAQTPPSTLHLVSTAQRGVGFFPKGRPRQGDRVGFGDKITGDATGTSRGVCTFIGKQLLCTIQVQLSNGTLSAQGMVPQRSSNNPVAIVGGTGAYNGARGTAFVTDVSQTKSNITVELVP
jgi:Dirigent-like protein